MDSERELTWRERAAIRVRCTRRGNCENQKDFAARAGIAVTELREIERPTGDWVEEEVFEKVVAALGRDDWQQNWKRIGRPAKGKQ